MESKLARRSKAKVVKSALSRHDFIKKTVFIPFTQSASDDNIPTLYALHSSVLRLKGVYHFGWLGSSSSSCSKQGHTLRPYPLLIDVCAVENAFM